MKKEKNYIKTHDKYQNSWILEIEVKQDKQGFFYVNGKGLFQVRKKFKTLQKLKDNYKIY